MRCVRTFEHRHGTLLHAAFRFGCVYNLMVARPVSMFAPTGVYCDSLCALSSLDGNHLVFVVWLEGS